MSCCRCPKNRPLIWKSFALVAGEVQTGPVVREAEVLIHRAEPMVSSDCPCGAAYTGFRGSVVSTVLPVSASGLSRMGAMVRCIRD